MLLENIALGSDVLLLEVFHCAPFRSTAEDGIR